MLGRFAVNNNVRVMLTASINAVATSATFSAAAGVFKNPANPAGDTASGGVGIATLVDSLTNPTKTEIVTYTTLTNNGDGTYTISGLARGQQGTSGQSWGSGSILTQAMTHSMLLHPQFNYDAGAEQFNFLKSVEVADTIGARDIALTNPVSLIYGGTGATTAANARANLGLAALATLGSVNNSNWSGTALALGNGGTGATSASAARTALGLAIGTDVQAYDADLAGIAGITDLLGAGTIGDAYRVPTRAGTALGGAWIAMRFSALGTYLIGQSSEALMRTTLGLAIGTDVQAYDADLAAIAGLTSAADRLPYFNGSGTAALATFTAAGRALVDDADATAQRATLAAAGTGVANTFSLTQTFTLAPIFTALTGYVKGNGASAASASATIPLADVATIAQGTWTPTVTATANAGSVSGNLSTYSRVGSIVTIAGSINLTPSSSGTTTTVEFTLPIASNMTIQQDGSGAANGQLSNFSGILAANSTTDRFVLQFVSGDTIARTWFFSGQYVIK